MLLTLSAFGGDAVEHCKFSASAGYNSHIIVTRRADTAIQYYWQMAYREKINITGIQLILSSWLVRKILSDKEM